MTDEIVKGNNAGNWNTGNWNTGNWNTGDWNTGDWNTGDKNTGHRNTGNWNAGNWNAGNWNTGNWNAGDGNATDRCSGFLCIKEQPFIIFDEPADRNKVDFFLVNDLCENLTKDEPFDYLRYIEIPNATEEKIKLLHQAHIERRKKK